ncbi:hypothetical protein NGF19_26750 [Streptomyces sp. RY43-2]|uniref:DUF3558 domain-containing protein n=1 Tax=Streptomyces macrolidinus TaxID=2952607 RepID=A0ABT0ZLA7_9ACTN|nr:hypothetical protein [Streptomyces macrolidinus]MCN9244341.1 hypothetical protein [Streptomyces macrolidinus]
MRSLPLPLAVTVRVLPVVVLAVSGWALSSETPDPAPAPPPVGASGQQPQNTPAAPDPTVSASAAAKTYTVAPAPCSGLSEKTISSLVPGAKPAGKEIPSTDKSLRRTCSWHALKGYDYRWLDVSFEVMGSDAQARQSYEERTARKSGGGAVPGLGDTAYSVVDLTTEDKQETREGMVLARASNALVVVTYNGSDFETKKAPGTDEINRGAIKAAKDAVAALGDGRKS